MHLIVFSVQPYSAALAFSDQSNYRTKKNVVTNDLFFVVLLFCFKYLKHILCRIIYKVDD